MINILIADNQVITREGIKSMLADIVDMRVTGCVKSRAELEQKIASQPPQVIIIDPNDNQCFTIADIIYLYKQYPLLHILVLTNKQPKAKVLAVLDTGIKNHVFKACSREELVTAIYKTANGAQFFCQNTFESLFGNKLLPEREEPVAVLSSRENEIIQLIAAGKTNKEIAGTLFLSIHTIKTHRKNIIKKIGFTFKNAADLMSYTTQV
jgi:DNA-binding NarL/FixJ family response regulator